MLDGPSIVSPTYSKRGIRLPSRSMISRKHLQRPHPQAALAIESAVDHDGLLCFRVECKIDNFIFVTFEVPIATSTDRLHQRGAGERAAVAAGSINHPFDGCQLPSSCRRRCHACSSALAAAGNASGIEGEGLKNGAFLIVIPMLVLVRVKSSYKYAAS